MSSFKIHHGYYHQRRDFIPHKNTHFRVIPKYITNTTSAVLNITPGLRVAPYAPLAVGTVPSDASGIGGSLYILSQDVSENFIILELMTDASNNYSPTLLYTFPAEIDLSGIQYALTVSTDGTVFTLCPTYTFNTPPSSTGYVVNLNTDPATLTIVDPTYAVTLATGSNASNVIYSYVDNSSNFIYVYNNGDIATQFDLSTYISQQQPSFISMSQNGDYVLVNAFTESDSHAIVGNLVDSSWNWTANPVSFRYSSANAYGSCMSASGQFMYMYASLTQQIAYSLNYGSTWSTIDASGTNSFNYNGSVAPNMSCSPDGGLLFIYDSSQNAIMYGEILASSQTDGPQYALPSVTFTPFMEEGGNIINTQTMNVSVQSSGTNVLNDINYCYMLDESQNIWLNIIYTAYFAGAYEYQQSGGSYTEIFS